MFYLMMPSTLYLWLYGVSHMVKNHSDNDGGNHRQDSTYHVFVYTSHGALAGTRNNSMNPP